MGWFDLLLKIQFGSVNKLGSLDSSYINTRFTLLPCQSILETVTHWSTATESGPKCKMFLNMF